MSLVLFDTIRSRQQLYPFTAIRPVSEIRIGLLRISEWWSFATDREVVELTESYLQRQLPAAKDFLYVDATLIPDEAMLHTFLNLQEGEGIICQQEILAVVTSRRLDYGFTIENLPEIRFREWTGSLRKLNYPFEIAQLNAEAIREDVSRITQGRSSQNISPTNQVIAPEQIFIEEGAVVEHCLLNASTGPVYIGKNCLVMEGSMIRGPFAMLENSVVKMGSKIYGATTVGVSCTVGGEIKNVVFFDYSNKAHDGYLGDAVIGTWCNIGAGTSCSNVKNTAGDVKVWNQELHQWINAGMKCGVLMGDYTRTAINTSLNTGTVTGISCNVFNNGFVPKYVADFTWNCSTKERYVFTKVLSDLGNWMQFKKQQLSERDEQILSYLYSKQSQTN
jgi:UDP-N-acetylglucosamine diphosphorylase/glucosamine-1-phosphate N-acetyltransferase